MRLITQGLNAAQRLVTQGYSIRLDARFTIPTGRTSAGFVSTRRLSEAGDSRRLASADDTRRQTDG